MCSSPCFMPASTTRGAHLPKSAKLCACKWYMCPLVMSKNECSVFHQSQLIELRMQVTAAGLGLGV